MFILDLELKNEVDSFLSTNSNNVEISCTEEKSNGCPCCNSCCHGDCVNGCYSSCQGEGQHYW